MLNNYYKLYIDSTFKLAETIAIKFEDAAVALNEEVKLRTGVAPVKTDKTTWKYYQNISGAYHVDDEVMTVLSIDGVDNNPLEIVFNKENLESNRQTRLSYLYDTRYYRELVNRYPAQELLILGILYAPDTVKVPSAKDETKIVKIPFIEHAVNCPNGTILYYPAELIEPNEYSLRYNIQQWIYNHIDRWVNGPFKITDDLYPATYMAQIYMNLVSVILNKRLAACKTNEAHIYHIREYLASHGMLDKYLDSLTRNQALYLYRNIRYIRKNAGKRDTFDWLVDNLMTSRGLPLYEYTMKHDISNMLPTEGGSEQLNYHPDPFFKRKRLNFVESGKVTNHYGYDQMLAKIEPVAAGNAYYHTYFGNEIKEQLQDAQSNVVYTKTLESVIDDNSTAVPYTLESVLVNHWIYWSSKGYYTARIKVLPPGAKEAVILDTKEVLVLYLYSIYRALGIRPTHVPKLLATRVLREDRPSVEEFMGNVEMQYLTETQLFDMYFSVYQVVISDNPTNVGPRDLVLPVTNSDQFYLTCDSMYTSTLSQYADISVVENDNTAAQLQVLCSSLYTDRVVDLEITETFDEWLASKGLDYSTYSDFDFYNLSDSLVKNITDYTVNQNVSIKKIQRAMVEILGLLSSYSVHFISDVNNPSVSLVPNKSVKLMGIVDIAKNEFYAENAIIEPQAVDTVEHEQFWHYIEPSNYSEICTVEKGAYPLKISDLGMVGQLQVGLFDDPKRDPVEVELSVFGALDVGDPYAGFTSLTAEQKKEITTFLM